MGQTASHTHLGRGAWLADGTGRLGVFPLAARRTALTCLCSAWGGRQTMCVEGFLLSVLPQGTMMCQGETFKMQFMWKQREKDTEQVSDDFKKIKILQKYYKNTHRVIMPVVIPSSTTSTPAWQVNDAYSID